MKRMIRNIFAYCSLLIILCLSGCRPRGILHSWEMKSVLIDLHKADAMMQMAGISYGNEEARRIYYAQVLEKNGVTQAEFDSSLVWYTAHPQLFDKIYPRVLNELKAQEQEYAALHQEELDAYYYGQGRRKAEVRIIFTQSQLDSVLWVTQHGYPSMWNPLVQDLEDQFFPQIGVLR